MRRLPSRMRCYFKPKHCTAKKASHGAYNAAAGTVALRGPCPITPGRASQAVLEKHADDRLADAQRFRQTQSFSHVPALKPSQSVNIISTQPHPAQKPRCDSGSIRFCSTCTAMQPLMTLANTLPGTDINRTPLHFLHCAKSQFFGVGTRYDSI